MEAAYWLFLGLLLCSVVAQEQECHQTCISARQRFWLCPSAFIACFSTSWFLQADEAMATYRTCIADANTQKQELEDTKVNALRQIHEVVRQTDQVIKSVSLSLF